MKKWCFSYCTTSSTSSSPYSNSKFDPYDDPFLSLKKEVETDGIVALWEMIRLGYKRGAMNVDSRMKSFRELHFKSGMADVALQEKTLEC